MDLHTLLIRVGEGLLSNLLKDFVNLICFIFRTSSSSAGSCSEDSNQEPTTTTATPTPAAVSGASSSSNGVSAGVLQAEYDDEDLKPATKNGKHNSIVLPVVTTSTAT